MKLGEGKQSTEARHRHGMVHRMMTAFPWLTKMSGQCHNQFSQHAQQHSPGSKCTWCSPFYQQILPVPVVRISKKISSTISKPKFTCAMQIRFGLKVRGNGPYSLLGHTLCCYPSHFLNLSMLNYQRLCMSISQISVNKTNN